MGKFKTKIMAVITIMTVCLFMFAGCAGKGIEGTWVLKEEYEASGKKISSRELSDMGISEEYEIHGTEVKYTCVVAGLKKPVNMTFELEDLGGNKYNFKITDTLNFATAEVKGNTMTYEVGEGAETMKMVFKRK